MAGGIFSLDHYSFNVNAIPPLITAVATLFVGLFVILREKGSRVSILFLIYALTAFLWLFSYAMARFSPVEQVVFLWAKILHVGIALLPAALYHFTAVVLQTHEKRKRSLRVVWAAAMLFLALVLFTNALFEDFYYYHWGPYIKYKWSSIPFIVYFFSATAAILRSYWVEFRRSAENSTQRRRARALLVAFCIGYLAAFDFLPTVGIPYYPLGFFPMFVMLILITRVIWRYRLVDITPAFAAHQIIDTMSDALLVLDHEGVIRVTNRAAAVLFDRPEQEMTGKPVTTIIGDPLFLTQIEQVNSSGGIKNFELACCPRDSTVVLSFSASALRDRSGQPAGIVCVARDITDKKTMEDERLRSQKLESLGVLAGGIAHDFNNLLTGILGYISLARKLSKQDDVAQRLAEAEKASLWAKDLTKQLLAFSRGGAPVKKTASIGALIRDSAEFALRGARNRAEFHIPGDLWPVDVDEGQIRQVIHNLVLNADEAMPQGGIVEVRCENTIVGAGDDIPLEKGKYVRLSIKDQGTGIQKEHLQKIFDPYFTTKQKGSGLGLATAYSIIKNHGGYITVESAPGAGTVFHLYFAASPQEKRHAEKQQTGGPVAGKGRVLLMDDEELVRNVAAEMLRHFGYAIEVANDGHEAVNKYKAARESRVPFDVVILDLTVPGGMGGKETVQRLHEIDPHVKAIASSGYSQDTVMSEYEKHGFAGVVPKPYKIGELSEAVQKAMNAGPAFPAPVTPRGH